MAEPKFEIRVHKHYTVDLVEGGKSKPLTIARTRAEAEEALRQAEKDFLDKPRKSSKSKR